MVSKALQTKKYLIKETITKKAFNIKENTEGNVFKKEFVLFYLFFFCFKSIKILIKYVKRLTIT